MAVPGSNTIQLRDYPKEQYSAFFEKCNAVDHALTRRLGKSKRISGNKIVEVPRYSDTDIIARIYGRKTGGLIVEKEFRYDRSQLPNPTEVDEEVYFAAVEVAEGEMIDAADAWLLEEMEKHRIITKTEQE